MYRMYSLFVLLRMYSLLVCIFVTCIHGITNKTTEGDKHVQHLDKSLK